MKTLLEILSMKRPHGGKNEQRVATEILTRLPYQLQVFEDLQGSPMAYLIQTDPDSTTLFVAHLDTCHKDELVPNPVIYDELRQEMFKEDGECLGADDGAGVWMLYKMIEAGVPGSYLFTVGEERGGVGARWMASNAQAFLGKFRRAIEFDRAGVSSVITHQGWCARCCSDEFAVELSHRLSKTTVPLYFAPDDTGIYTDTAEFTEFIPECTNISVGYNAQHSGKETLDEAFLQDLLAVCIVTDWESLPTVRDPKEVDHTDWRYLNGGSVYNDDLTLYDLKGKTFEELSELAWNEPDAVAGLLYSLVNDAGNDFVELGFDDERGIA